MQLLLTDVGSVTIKKRLLAYFEEYGPVEPLRSAAELMPRPAVVVGDLFRVVERLTAASSDPLSRLVRRQPTAVAGLLRTRKDELAVSRLHQVTRCVEGRFLVKRFPAPNDPDEDREFVGRILDCVSPDFLLTARLLPKGSIALEFGDGLTGEIPLPALRLDRLDRKLLPETVRASCEGDSLQIDDRTGYTVDVDCEVLRGLLDKKHAAGLRGEADAVRREVGRRIRNARRSRGATQAGLSNTSGIAQEAISRIENGKQAPRADTLMKLADALDLPVDQLLGAGETG
ncbi:MAG TPA: helix-turn-helix transcriptional regulator [Thermoguttaceae bacterium]|nr:helix-turn-helix transcriptional regulator [Thermoguttaceae bacterium]